MAKTEHLVKEGKVTETLPNANFKVEFEDGKVALAYISGKMRRYRIRIIPGDRVRVEFSPCDETRGRVVYRYK